MWKLNLIMAVSVFTLLTSCVSVYEKVPEPPSPRPDLSGLRINIEGVRATEKIGSSTGTATASGGVMMGM
jgi:hypothetical protein